MKTDKIFKTSASLSLAAIACALFTIFFSVISFAAGEGESQTGADKGISRSTAFTEGMTWEESGLSVITDLAITVLKYAGYCVMVVGVANLVAAFKDDNSDSKVRATTMIGVGAALSTISSFTDGII